MEVLYLSEKNRISVNLKETLEQIESKNNYLIIDLNSEILKVTETISFPELHDRLILATAKWLDVPVISNDKDFSSVEGIITIWN